MPVLGALTRVQEGWGPLATARAQELSTGAGVLSLVCLKTTLPSSSPPREPGPASQHPLLPHPYCWLPSSPSGPRPKSPPPWKALPGNLGPRGSLPASPPLQPDSTLWAPVLTTHPYPYPHPTLSLYRFSCLELPPPWPRPPVSLPRSGCSPGSFLHSPPPHAPSTPGATCPRTPRTR